MKNILFVCTGNTCRSAMAKGICDFLSKKSGAEITADSCGLMADGSPACENAVLALKELYSADLSSHISKNATKELIDCADEIFAMTKSHAGYILSYFPSAADKLFVADPEIPDPFMLELDVYKNTAEELCSQIKNRYFSED